VSAAAIVAGVTAYAVYFDYKRRTDVDFRKELKKDRKRVKKSVAASEKDGLADSLDVTPAALKEALQVIQNEEGPKNSGDKEAYFLTQVADGEQLTSQGPQFYLPAAMAFYRALRIYPNPVDLLGIYQKTITEPVFKLIVAMTNLDPDTRPTFRGIIPGMGQSHESGF
jgi:import receptor subunit TOM20